jgi:hypothetical protein
MTMMLSFSGTDIRNSTEEELRESMRRQIQEHTDNQQQKERVQPCTTITPYIFKN